MAGPAYFEKHLFISYAHIDNQPLAPDQKGWVSRFHESLEAMLSMRLGRRAAIWRDLKLSGNDVFADEIVAQFPKTAILISVLTPRYVESEWCTREVREFCKAAELSGGVVSDKRSRIVKVIKTPVDSEGPLPSVMKDVLGYPFYVFDECGTPLELDPAFGPEMGPKYHLKIAKLAWDISLQLKQLVPPAAEAAGTLVEGAGTSRPTVYLAECSWDQRQAREALEADLRMHGYPILPARPLPRQEEAYLAEVTRMLALAKLSIHLVGSTYGAVPDGPAGQSVVVLQNELAAQRSRIAGLRRVIALQDGTKSEHAEQQQFIDMLHRDAEAQLGADLLICDNETLKAAIHVTLEKLQRPEPPITVDSGGARRAKLVYIICDSRDRKATIPVRKFLKGHWLDVQIPVFHGDAAAVRKANSDLLAQCDAVILFYGAGDESWKRTVESDLRKLRGTRRDTPQMAVYTYLSDPPTDDKQELIDIQEPLLINGLGGFTDAAAQPLLWALRDA
jgi:hypothetical protein